MSRNTLLLILFLLCMAGLVGYLKYQLMGKTISLTPNLPQDTSSPSSVASPTPGVLGPIDIAFQGLSDRQKILQLIAYPVSLPSTVSTASASVLAPADQEFLTQNTPGFITLFGNRIALSVGKQAVRDITQLVATSSSSTSLLTPLFAVDHEGGSVQRLSGNGYTRLPTWRVWCQSTSEAKIASVSASVRELKETGINIVFGPVVDVASDASAASFQSRMCSDDPVIVVQEAERWGELFADQGIWPVIKHYPGIGSSEQNLHMTAAEIFPSATEKKVFSQILSDFPAWAVMVGHGSVRNGSLSTEAASESADLVPCSLEINCIQPLQQSFPDTLLFTDGLEMKSLPASLTLSQMSVQALQAGNDVLVFGTGVTPAQFNQLILDLTNSYQTNPELRKIIDEHVRRILIHKNQLLPQ